MDTVMQRVEKGAELLNRYFGNEEWKTKIDLDKLNIENSEDCVLGQLFGDYAKGAESIELELNLPTYDWEGYDNREFDINDYWPFQHGFNVKFDYVRGALLSTELNKAWRNYLSR